MTPRLLERSPWRDAQWLVIAPHPDDETLGAGALIHHAAAREQLAGIVFLTDGAGSHPEGTPRLQAVRRQEATRAARRLTQQRARIDWLGWTDGTPHADGSSAFRRTAMRLGRMIRDHRIDALAVSDPGDGHCDHVAAFALARAAQARSRRRLQLFTYSVWNVPSCRGALITTPAMPSGLRRQALGAHRSQLSPRMGDGFRLPREMRRMTAADHLTAVGWPR